MADSAPFTAASIPAERVLSGTHTAFAVPLLSLVILEQPNETCVWIPTFLLSKVVYVRVLLVRKTLPVVEGKLWEVGLAGGPESMPYAISWRIQGVGEFGRDLACHEEGTGLEATVSSPTQAGSMS